jgi:uncharacterized protein YggE
MKKNLFILPFILCSFFATIGFAQITTQNNEVLPVIELTGTAEREVIPDEIFIHITIKERFDGRSKITVEEQEKKLKKEITELGISIDNLFLSDANANYTSVSWFRDDVISQTFYLLKVENAELVSRVFKCLHSIEINDARVSHVSHSEIEEIRKEVRIEAISAAKEKADYLLKAIGQKTGKAMYVRENADVRPYRQYELANVSYSIKQKEESQPLQFKKMTITSSIYVRFLIE